MPSTIRALKTTGSERFPSGAALPWGAHIAVRFPEGVERHPLLLDRVGEQLGRIAALDVAHTGVRVAVGLHGSDRSEAEHDCAGVVARMLDLLGLPESSLEECTVFERDTSILAHPVGPSPVPDLPKSAGKR